MFSTVFNSRFAVKLNFNFMKLNSITNRYILKEMFIPFSINIFVFTFLFLMTEMLEIANWIVNYKLSI